MLRARIRKGAEQGTSVEATMQSGALVSDEVVNLMVQERLRQADAAKGFVLDGYPRTLMQAEHLCGWLDGCGIREVVIHLAVDYNIIIDRLTGRRECPRCGTLYNVTFNPPKVEGLCDRDGEKLQIRDDDQEPVIRGRLDAYDRQTHPVLEFYRAIGRRVVDVDASTDPPKAVFEKIWQAIKGNGSCAVPGGNNA